ncbi:MAG: CpaF family protein, partial [Actinomycetota bacterium]
DGSRRVTHVTEVVGMEGDVVTLQDVFLFDFRAGVSDNGRPMGVLKPTGLRPKFLEKLEDHNVHMPPGLFMPEGLGVRV